MKARLLTKLLNDTGYCVNNNDKYIAVGSPYCHDLIKVDKETLTIKYALGTRESLLKKDTNELLLIFDKLQELIDNGQIHDIINGNDEIENPLTVYTIEDGKLVETYTDAYGWPNTTHDGYVMYDNTHFKDKKDAIEYGVKDYSAGVSMSERRIKELEADLEKAKDYLAKDKEAVLYFKSLKNELLKEV